MVNDNEILDRLDTRLLGLSTNLESQVSNDSSARSAMRSSFLTQMLVLKGSTPRRIVTLAEREYAKYTHKVQAPEDIKVIKVIQKYPRARGILQFRKNSETIIVYESVTTGEIGHLVIPTFHWNHKVFGFDYKVNPIVKNLNVGDYLAKGTVLADSPAVQSDGDYHYGIEANIAYMSLPGVIEDGFIVSESFCQKTKTRGYGSKVLEFGMDTYPLNLYGDDTNYKIFPDIGERVRDDGVLFATREYDDLLAVCNMTKEALQHIDHTYDKVHYISLSSVDPTDMPIVEDINIWHSDNKDYWKTPIEMTKQVKRYHESVKHFHTDIINVYREQYRYKQKNLKTTNSFHSLVCGAFENDNNLDKTNGGRKVSKSITRTYRSSKLDDWRVEIKYGWDITPGIGYKYTGMHG